MKFGFKKDGNFLNIIVPNDSIGDIIYFVQYDLDKNLKSINTDGIASEMLENKLNDFVFIDSTIYSYGFNYKGFVSNNVLYKIDLRNKKESKLLSFNKKKSIKNIEKINQNLLLLYSIYPNHPGSGFNKAEFYIYDIKKNKIIKEKLIDFEAVVIGEIVHEWVYVDDENIYIVFPLSGKLQKWNSDLNLVKEYELHLNNIDFSKNAEFIQVWNKEYQKSYDSYKNILSNKNLPFFDKATITEKVETLRNKSDYIEKIMDFNDSVFAISVYKANYQKEFRDLYLIDKKSMDVIKFYPKWRAMRSNKNDVIESFEDFITVDLGISKIVQPFFYKDNAYILIIFQLI